MIEKAAGKPSGAGLAGGVSWILMGSLVVQAVGFAVKPIVGRWLGPTGLGLYSLSFILYGLAGLVGNFGVSQSLVRYTAANEERHTVLGEVCFSGLLVSAVCGALAGFILFQLRQPIASLLHEPAMASCIAVISFSIPFSSLILAETGLLNGLRRMATFAGVISTQVILRALLVLVLARLGRTIVLSLWGLVLSDAVTSVLGALAIRRLGLLVFKPWRRTVRTAVRLLSFGRFMLGVSAVNNVSNRVDSLLIGYFMSTASVGAYTPAKSLAALLELVPTAVRRMVFAHTSRLWSLGKRLELLRTIEKGMKYSASVMLLVGVGAGLFAKDAVRLLFGAEYVVAVAPLYALIAIRVLTGGLTVPIGSLFPALGKPGINLGIEILILGVNVGLAVLLIPRLEMLGAALAMVVSLGIGHGIQLGLLRRIAGVRVDTQWYCRALCIAGTAVGMSIMLERCGMNALVARSMALLSQATATWLLLLTAEDRKGICLAMKRRTEGREEHQ